jgi:hypothetical protein
MLVGLMEPIMYYVPVRPGMESWWGLDFPHPSRPVLRPTQPPVQVMADLVFGGKATGTQR